MIEAIRHFVDAQGTIRDWVDVIGLIQFFILLGMLCGVCCVPAIKWGTGMSWGATFVETETWVIGHLPETAVAMMITGVVMALIFL